MIIQITCIKNYANLLVGSLLYIRHEFIFNLKVNECITVSKNSGCKRTLCQNVATCNPHKETHVKLSLYLSQHFT
jgi:hypothetical protein